MSTVQHEVDVRTNLISSNKFELLLFRLGDTPSTGRSELFGINVFKVREIVAMPVITVVAGALPHNLGVVNLRGQIIPVIDLCSVVGCVPKSIGYHATSAIYLTSGWRQTSDQQSTTTQQRSVPGCAERQLSTVSNR